MYKSSHLYTLPAVLSSCTLSSSQSACTAYISCFTSFSFQNYFSNTLIQEGAKRLHFLFWHQKYQAWHFNLSKQLKNTSYTIHFHRWQNKHMKSINLSKLFSSEAIVCLVQMVLSTNF